MKTLIHAIPVILFAALAAQAGDWPQFLGPLRNGSTEEAIAGTWEAKSPKVLWTKKAGTGFAGPVVLGNTVFLFHREGKSEIISALETAGGKVIWESKAPTDYQDDFGFDDGPRATPCAAEGRLYVMGAEGLVRCVTIADGNQVWAVNTKKDFKASKGFFGMACSPLAHGPNVLLNIGGEGGAGIVALDKETGALRWKATAHEASCSSPVIGALNGKTAAVFLTREGLVILDPDSGSVRAEHPWRARMHASVNAASPLVIDGMIFATSSYGTGAILASGQLQEIWSGDEILSCHYATPAPYQGHLYGFHGRQETRPSLRCVELKTGKVLWDEPSFGGGSVTRAGKNLLILKDNGELLLAPANPNRFEVTGRTQLLGSEARAYPAVSERRIYARDKRNWICAELP